MSEEDFENENDVPPRIFINNLNNYLSRNLAVHLATCKPGQTVDVEDGFEGGDMAGDKGNQNESDLPSQQKPSGYRIVGTVSQPGAEIPKFVETILNVSFSPFSFST
uniref:KH_dom_type_1 domain-containing protein n=1 Tax=Mesocestoides corti TaxID=53468 RepID=A0A5K3EXJ9_MESCO